MTLQALLFDVFGTVVDWRTSIRDDLQRWFSAQGIERDWEAFAQDWRAKYQPAMERVRSGNREYVRLDVLHRENLDELLIEYELSTLPEAAREYVNRTWHRLLPWPDSIPGLTQLRRDYLLATLSNGNIALIANMARFTGLPWDAILGAEITRSYKPDPNTYTRSMEALGLEPAQCMMVAAHNSDLRQARSLGMRTAFVARPHEYGTRQVDDFEPDEDWDVCCSSMVELADQLSEKR